MTDKIIRNAIRCNHCGAIIVSAHHYDFATHQCAALTKLYGKDGFIAADGGSSYLRRLGNREDWTEISEWGK